MTLVRLYSPRSPLGTPMPSGARLHQLVFVPEGEEGVGYESKVVDPPAGHDGPRFALGVCSEQGSDGVT